MTGHIFLEGEIGTDVTLKTVRDEISLYPQAENFTVHINSPGGDVYEGYAIGNLLRNLGKPTTAAIGALCASIATYAASCCDRIVMPPHGDFMIHLPTGTLSGNAEDLRRGAAQLDRIKSELIERYMIRVGKYGVTREQLSAMIDKETSMSPIEAKAMGFVDDVQEKLKAVAKMDLKKFNDMENKDEVKGMLESFGKKLDAFFDKFKVKNVALTLADGSIIQSDSPDAETVVGSTVTDEQGTPLPDGTYPTADGLALVVAGGKVQSADPVMEDKKDDPAALKAEIEQLKQQLAAQTQAVADQNKVVAEQSEIVKAAAKAKADFKALQDEFNKMKNETFGDPTPPIDAPDKKEAGKKTVDPMLEAMERTMGQAFKTSRFN